MFKLPDLPYGYEALEPYIDAKTMEIHYSKHHASYVKNLNDVLKGSDFERLENSDLLNLLTTLDKIPVPIRQTVRNNAGGHANHSFFWLILNNPGTKEARPTQRILQALETDFGNYENFLKLFKSTAMARFGSGWAWLVMNPVTKKLEVLSTPNQDSPLMEHKIPVLGVDVWEHAYYLKHQNMRANWLEDFFKVLNWEQIEENYELALQVGKA